MTENHGTGWIGYKPPPPKPHHERRKKWMRRIYITNRDRVYLKFYSVVGLNRNRREFA